MENTTPQENFSEPITPAPIEQEQVEKAKEVKKKKSVFVIAATVFGAIFVLILALLISVFVYKNYLAPRIQVVTPPQQPEEEENTQVKNYLVEKTALYKSDNLKLSLEYSKDAKLIDTWDETNQTKKLEIFFSKDVNLTTVSESISESEISDGYIFRISTFTTNVRNLDDIAKVKKESIAAGCPESSEFSETYPTKIDGVDSRVFEVKNCRGDFIVTYTPKFGVYYAFEQIYKGDIGYKQKQKASTQEILDSIRFYPEPTGPEQPFETFTNESPKFSFEHPKFDGTCCNLQGPPTSTNDQKIVTLVDKETFVDNNNFDGISIFIYKLNTQQYGNFDSFLDTQKKTLIDDYVVVRGTSPKLQEVSMKIGDRDAVLLRGYSWRETDLIYTSFEGGYNSFALVISVKNMSGDKFEAKLDRIFSSFKFFQTP